MNYSSLIDVSLPGCQKVKVEIVDQQIMVTLKYSSTIDQMTAKLTMDFDNNYVLSPKFRS